MVFKVKRQGLPEIDDGLLPRVAFSGDLNVKATGDEGTGVFENHVI